MRYLRNSSYEYENEPSLLAPQVLVPVWAPCDISRAGMYCEQRPHFKPSF